MAPAGKSGAAMSSRLATMKFMQRAAASSPDATQDRSAKRQRLSNGSFQSSPSAAPGSDAEAIQKVLAAEERKRQEAVDREAARRGETKWVLDVKVPQSVKPPVVRVLSAGYNTLDSTTNDDDGDDDENEFATTPQTGRRKFGTHPVKAATPRPTEEDNNIDPDEDKASYDPGSPPRKSKAFRTGGLGDARGKQDFNRRKSDHVPRRQSGLSSGGGNRKRHSNMMS